MAGIIGGLSAAMQGGGAAGVAGSLIDLKAYNDANHEKLKQQLEGEREQRNMALQDQYATARQQQQQTFEHGEHTEERKSREGMTAAQIASREKIAAAHDAILRNSLRYSGKSIQTDANGNMGVVDVNTGRFVQIKDADGNPAKGMKDLPLSVKSYLGVVTPQLTQLQHAKANALAMGQDTAGYDQQIAELNQNVLTAITTSAVPELKPAAPAAAKPGDRPPLSSFFGGGASSPQAPAQGAPAQAATATPAPAASAAQPAPQPAATAAPAQAESNKALAVDTARAKLAAAQKQLGSYGLLQRRRDPNGFAAAQAAVTQAQSMLDNAMGAYQTELGPLGAATYQPRTR